jgi:hypothetical protein
LKGLIIQDLKVNQNSTKIEVETMLEKEIEKKFRMAVKTIGGMALKFISPGLAGVPDRLVLLPKGRIYFVELKRLGGKLRPLQVKRKRQLERLGFSVYCLGSEEGIELFLQEVGG